MEEKRESSNFIEAEINKDIENNVYEGGRGTDKISTGT